MRILLVTAAVVLVVVPVHASEPGEPLDCSDWVFLEPGLSCRQWSVSNAVPQMVLNRGSNLVVDNVGAVLFVRHSGDPNQCPDSVGEDAELTRLELVRYDGSSEHILGYVESREEPPSSKDLMRGRMAVNAACGGNCGANCGLQDPETLLSFDPTSFSCRRAD